VTPRQVQKTIEADLACKHRVTPQQLEKTMKELSDNISFFDDDNFSFVRFLQSAPRNKGQVNHMEMREGNFVRAVVEKRMPRSWMLRSHDEFRRRCPLSVEQPWVDIAIVKELNRHRYQYACDFLGIFEGNEKLHVITSFADQGDLFGWIDTNLRQLGPSRESRIKPIAAQLCDAACWLHQLGIAHRDISLENVVLCTTKDNLGLKLIDFGMAVAARYSEGASYGKGPYKAPEMHTHTVYDAFLTDTFATGVVLLSMVMAAYPWENTTPDGDPKFTKAMVMGMPNCLQSMKTRLPGGAVSSLSQVASNEMLELLAGLLALQPCRRHTLGESCRRMRFSVWDGPWLRGLRPNHGFGIAESDATSPFLPIS
jgi:serine/threonine protein kinase